MTLASISVVLVCWGCATASQPVLPDAAVDETSERPPAQTADNGAQRLPIEAQATVGDRQIYFEVAKTPRQQQIGLMFRQQVGPQCGMVFPFEPPRPVRFWMQNVPISLDMLFLRADVVRAIEANVPPCDRAAVHKEDKDRDRRGGRSPQ
ncbi:MAG: DUF192 domain-containing protein, partial [Cyanobacteria bacterium J06641_5]